MENESPCYIAKKGDTKVRFMPYIDHLQGLEGSISDNVNMVYRVPGLFGPDLSLYMYNKADTIEDLDIIIDKMFWLNPRPNFFLRRMMASHIVRHYVHHYVDESEILYGRFTMKPKMRYEQVLECINSRGEMYIPDQSAVCDKKYYYLLHSCNTFDREQKIAIAKLIYTERHNKLMTELVDNAVDFLIETDQFTRVTVRRIEEQQLVQSSHNKPASYATIKKYLSAYAKRRMNQANMSRLFTDRTLSDKLNLYLQESIRMSLSMLVENYNISKKTAVLFNRVKDDYLTFNS